tara:strand:+ start:164 stop:544 length:381 start_codon:yes stop_codon:yes gene_type:complete
MQRAVSLLRANWSKAVIEKDVSKLMKLYTKEALFKGTLSDVPVQGRKGIKKYFDDFVCKVKDIKFNDDNYLFRRDELLTEMGTYTFYLNDKTHKNEKVVANYQFIYEMQKRGLKIISHFSSLASCD